MTIKELETHSAEAAVKHIRWHSYIGNHVDAAVMADQANRRMGDYRDACSTIVHHHAHSVPCKGKEHTVYDHRDKSTTEKVFIEDGYEMWGVKDPAVK
jgi:hypothetical protein